jgi:hypothetical protein
MELTCLPKQKLEFRLGNVEASSDFPSVPKGSKGAVGR